MIKRIAELIVGNVGPDTDRNKAITGEQVISLCVSTTNPFYVPLLPITWLFSVWGHTNYLKYTKPEGYESYSLFGESNYWLYWRMAPTIMFEEYRPAVLRRSEKEEDEGVLESEGTMIVWPAIPRTWKIYSRLLISKKAPPIDEMIQKEADHYHNAKPDRRGFFD